MNIALESKDVITVAFAVPLLVAAGWDLAFYRIPNAISATVIVLFFACALTWGVQVNWLSHVGAGLAVLAAGFALFAFRVFGGGDVKILAGVALWIGWGMDLVSYLLAVAIAGGVLSLALVGMRTVVTTWGAAWPFAVPRVVQAGAPVPYGVAIAAVALWMAPRASQFIFLR